MEKQIGEKLRVCRWAPSKQVDFDMFETRCGFCFQFNDGGPIENSFKFCPFCGLPLTLKGKL
jgi:hypothetical protein